ncbi:acetolactate synthase large subunit [Rhodobacteraceae bacterium NNCM2]|nr:acetolactate synthase large subunit [Coraliihabitans acroporae]
MNGAESLVRTLLGGGVDVCFTNPGTSEMHFVAALDHVPGMHCVLVLQEAVATGAADGYWRMAGKPASTLLHLGPGLANGLSNLHNAKKAGSGIVNIVGEHAVDHVALDAPLTSDIAGIARPVSHWVHTSLSSETVGTDGAQAIAEASTPPGQIATLILPGDTAWNEGGVIADPLPTPQRGPVDPADVEAAAGFLAGPTDLLLLGGEALTEEGLELAGRIAAKTGCELLAEWSNARMERGEGRVMINRLPYPIDQALAVLAPYRRIVLVGAKAPVGFFAYPDKPGILTAEGTEFVDLIDVGADIAGALTALCDKLGATTTPPRDVAERFAPEIPGGPPTPDSIAAVLGNLIPENAIVVDESVTTGRAFFNQTKGAPKHSWLTNRGGSIGYCMPAAIGAAIACPDRKVISMNGDGSAMYTAQALWTMARENLDITVLIFANRSYRILHGELTNVGVANPGPRAVDMLTLNRPELSWVDLAKGMGVEACRVDDTEDLANAMRDGLASTGPYLIEVMV